MKQEFYDKCKERAAALVAQMTLEEKVLQLGNQAPSIPRLDLPAYNYWSEASHGYFGPFRLHPMDVTSYPVCLAMSQTWDEEKMRKVGAAIGDECRAHHNLHGVELHMWCPTINLARDPRNGRSDENFGEDPVLAGKMAAAYIQGMQGEEDDCLKTVATPKHYALNSSENNRHQGSSNVDEATLREYYTKVFDYAIEEGGARCIMTSYNRVNGVPSSCNEMLLKTLLREEWGFDGFVVSDAGAVYDVYENPMFNGGEEKKSGHYYAKNAKQASVMTLEAGCDMSAGMEYKRNILDACHEKMIDESVIDRALIRILATRFALGLFDQKTPYDTYKENRICSEEQKKLAVDMANDTIVLLKNDKNLLPLNKDSIKKILVIGPNAIYRELGGYSAGSISKVIETVCNVLPLQAIREEVKNDNINVVYEKGWCTDKEFDKGGVMNLLPGAGPGTGAIPNMEEMKETIAYMFGENADIKQMAMAFRAPDKFAPEDADKCGDEKVLWERARNAAKDADLIIVVAGTDSATAAEEHDRDSLALPYGQDEKIQELLEINENTIVILNTLGAVTGKFFEKAHTVINAHFAGQEQGTAIANVLFGKVNPSAKLTATWYKSQDDLAHINDYGIRKQDTLERKPRTYMYLEKEPLFPFGYGLSYTEFSYSDLKAEAPSMEDGIPAYHAKDTVKISVNVTNEGERDGAEIVEAYVAKVIPEGMDDCKPKRQLKAFAKVWLQAGETKTVHLEIPVTELRVWSYYHRHYIVEDGIYEIQIGKNASDIVAGQKVKVTGDWNAHLKHISFCNEKNVWRQKEEGVLEVNAVLEDSRRLKPEEYTVEYMSSDDAVISVSPTGMVRANKEGKAWINCRLTYRDVVMERKMPCVVKAD